MAGEELEGMAPAMMLRGVQGQPSLRCSPGSVVTPAAGAGAGGGSTFSARGSCASFRPIADAGDVSLCRGAGSCSSWS